MKVSEKDVLYVAELANLDLTPEEQTRMLHDLNSILDYIDRLNELDTDKVAPMANVPDGRAGGGLREDVRYGLRESLPHETALKNAPASDGTFFEVPKVIEK